MSNAPPTIEYRHVADAQIVVPWWMKLSVGLVFLSLTIGSLGLIRALVVDKNIEFLSCIGAGCLLTIGLTEWIGIRRRMTPLLILVGLSHLLFALMLIPGMLWVWHNANTWERGSFGLVLVAIFANATCHFAFAAQIAVRIDRARS